MLKKCSKFLSKIILLIDEIFFKIFKKRFKFYLQDELRKSSVTKILFKDKNYFFFTPSNLTYWRARTFESKEPETLDWIQNFKEQNPVFWDIGANIGLYSIFAAKENHKCEIIAFEPSGLNLGILEKNINLNKVNQNIKIFPIGLADKSNSFFDMYESSEEEGGALSSFGSDTGFDGNKINMLNNYKLFGTTVNALVKDNILKIPNYIKIDVDGNEDLILKNSEIIMNSADLKEILVEINEKYNSQFDTIMQLMTKYNFKVKSKNVSEYATNSKFKYCYNYIFTR